MNLICSALKAGHQTSPSRRPQPHRELQGEVNKSARPRMAALRPPATAGSVVAQSGALRGGVAVTAPCTKDGLSSGFVIRTPGQHTLSQARPVHACGCEPAPAQGWCKEALSALLVSHNSHFFLNSISLKSGEWEEGKKKHLLLPLHFAAFAHAHGM